MRMRKISRPSLEIERQLYHKNLESTVRSPQVLIRHLMSTKKKTMDLHRDSVGKLRTVKRGKICKNSLRWISTLKLSHKRSCKSFSDWTRRIRVVLSITWTNRYSTTYMRGWRRDRSDSMLSLTKNSISWTTRVPDAVCIALINQKNVKSAKLMIVWNFAGRVSQVAVNLHLTYRNKLR